MISEIIPQRRRDLGGFEVGRVLPHHGGRMVGPFIFFDHMGPTTLAQGLARSVDVRPHPHIGLATVTYLFDGELMHRDSVASHQAIRPGAVNWMVAGAGITHSERFEKARAEGDLVHGVQSWVALPEAEEERAPSFAHHPAGTLPTFAEPGVAGRVIAGRAYGLEAPARTFSPLFYVHAVLQPGASLKLPEGFSERAAYVVKGAASIDGREIGQGLMVTFGAGDAVVTAQRETILMALGGEPIGERFIEWNFVSSSKERIEQAKADWRAGRMKLPDGDDQEFTPLPA